MPEPVAGDVYVLLGNIGSGKTVQAQNLQTQLDGQSLAVGSLIRHHLSGDSRIAKGELLPDGEVIEIVTEAMAATSDSQPLIFDGFPRSLQQKQWLDQQLSTQNRQLVAALHLEVDEDEVNRRLHLRDRADDTPEAIKRRKQIFEETIMPVINAYKRDGVLREIDGNEEPAAVTDQILAAVGQK